VCIWSGDDGAGDNGNGNGNGNGDGDAVGVIVIILSAVLRQVDWQHQRQHQSFHRRTAFY
jgi:hypothetical protein